MPDGRSLAWTIHQLNDPNGQNVACNALPQRDALSLLGSYLGAYINWD
jgi:hypothetical protein